jgi:hypothetical protein
MAKFAADHKPDILDQEFICWQWQWHSKNINRILNPYAV